MDIYTQTLNSVVDARLGAIAPIISALTEHREELVLSCIDRVLRPSLLNRYGKLSQESLETIRGWQVSPLNQKVREAFRRGIVMEPHQLRRVLTDAELALWYTRQDSPLGQTKQRIDSQMLELTLRVLRALSISA